MKRNSIRTNGPEKGDMTTVQVYHDTTGCRN